MPPQKGSRRRLSEREQRQNLRAFRRCRALVKKARKVSLTVGLDLDEPPAFSAVAHQDRQSLSREIARQLQVPRIELWRAWRYVSVVDKYPRLAPPTCGLERALWMGYLLDRTPETERESQLADLLRLPKRALQLRYQHSHPRQRPQPKALKKLRGRKLQRISGAIWHERLVEIRQHMQQLGTRGLVELLFETWKPEVQQGYRRELQQLIDELTMLHHRLESVIEAEGSPRSHGEG